jgi:hypothetical protein
MEEAALQHPAAIFIPSLRQATKPNMPVALQRQHLPVGRPGDAPVYLAVEFVLQLAANLGLHDPTVGEIPCLVSDAQLAVAQDRDAVSNRQGLF